MIQSDRALRLASVIAVLVLAGGGILVWRALHPPGWHPGFGPHRLAMQVSRRCPDHLPYVDTVVNSGGGSPTQLVPPHPVAARICRYGPGRRGFMVLYRQVLLPAAPAAALASAADSIKSEAPSGAIDCPAGVFSMTALGFSYQGGNQAALSWDDSGCEEVDNGNLAAFQMNSGFAAFQSAVDAVAPPQSHRFEG